MQVFLITLLWTLLSCYVESQLRGEENAPPISNAQTQRRLALVIGNGAYTAPDMQPLANPVNDAEDIAKELSKFGFDVTLLKNATLEAMDETIHSFSSKINKGDVALLYYSGHGIQVGGENFLLPVDAKFKREDQVERQAIKASLLLHKLDNASTKLVFLDACRNNPFLVSITRGVGRKGTSPNGLAKLSAPDGTLLVYSTDPDNVAADGSGRNSPFTQALLKFIGSPGVDVQIMLRKVREEVKRNTDNNQTPWDNSSLVDGFYFLPVQENQQLPKEETKLADIKRQQEGIAGVKNQAEQHQNEPVAELTITEDPPDFVDEGEAEPEIQQPSIQIGDSYIYQSMDQLDPTSSSITKRTVIATNNGIILSSLVLNKKKAKPRKHYYDNEWCLINTRNYDTGGKDYAPPLKYFSFPLFPSKTWQQVSTETDIKTGKTRIHTITGTVGELEEVTVPAGTFKGIKVSLDTKLFDPSTKETMNGTDTSWYVPEIRRSVKSIMTAKDENKVIQLMSYELNPHSVPPITQSLTVRTSVQSFLTDSSHKWLVIASKPTIEETQALARQYQAQYPKTTIFLSENGWYGISVGLLEFPKQEYLKDQWIKQGRIPPDSYFTQGKRFRQQIDF